MKRWVVAALLAGMQAAQAAEPVIFRFQSPPAGFKPVDASDEELARYGLPSRPNPFARSSLPYDSWVRAMSHAQTRVEPEVRATGRRHGIVAITDRRQSPNLFSTNWAGQTIINPVTSFGASSYAKVIGQWVVSAVQQAIGTCSGTDVSSTWLGIDGSNGSSDVLQAGTEADAFCNGGNTATNYYPWFEWYPGNEYQITNFSVYPGAAVFVVVQAFSATSGAATFVNLASNQYTTVGIAAPAGTTLRGNTVEWIVERPATNSSGTKLGSLADYGMIWISSEVAYLASQIGSNTYDVPGNAGAGRSAYTYTMLDTSGNTLATSFPQGTSAQDLNVSGSAY